MIGGQSETGEGALSGHSIFNTIMVYTEPKIEELTDRTEQKELRGQSLHQLPGGSNPTKRAEASRTSIFR